MVEARLQLLEEGELRSERLKDVATRADVPGDEAIGPDVKILPNGAFKFSKATKFEMLPPENPEELRKKFKVIAVA